MEYLVWGVIVVAAGIAGIMGYCQYQQRADAKLQAAVDEYNRQIDREIHAKFSNELKPFTDHVKRIDDRQWRDWN